MTDPVKDFYLATVEQTFATARRVAGNIDIARDATHEAYAVMVDRWTERRNRSLADNQRYVIGIAVNKVADLHRKHRHLAPLPEEEDLPAADGGYMDVLDQLSLFKEVRSLLESQSVVTRTVGILYFLEDFKQAEIAQILDVDPSTVRTYVQRLRKRLQPLVEHLGWLDERR